MIAQPSPEAVDLVQAVIRAEWECVVEEEQNGFKTPRHWLLVGALDAASEALLQYVTTLESALADVSSHAENYVAVDTAHDDPAYAVHLMAQVIDALVEVTREVPA